jgi:outer membrane receptor for ferrienterochelin and colicin
MGVTALLLFVVNAAFGQSATTGALGGTVTADGAAIPGVTVTASSPSLQGVRTAITDVNGTYTFGLLPPGDYTVKFEMESMATQTRAVKVGVGQTARADAALKLTTVSEAITVTASSPAAVETTQVQANYQQQLIQELPVNRTLLGTVALAPGVNGNGPRGNQTISGAYSYDNLYMVNGVTVNENLRGQPHDLFIEDAIQETTVFTGGAISAEFGNFTGGVVNAITKSGGNDFTGSFRDSLTNDKWTHKSASPFTVNSSGVAVPITVADPRDKVNSVYEGTLGGRIVRDRLWFFAAGRDQKNNSQRSFARSAQTYARTINNRRFEAKLTGQVAPAHNLVVSYLNNDTNSTNDCQLTAGCLDPTGLDAAQSNPNKFYTARYNGILGSNFLVEAQYAKKKYAFVGYGGDDPDFQRGTLMRDFGETGSGEGFNAPQFGGVFPETRDHKEWMAKGSYYLGTKGFGTHNFVVGLNQFAEQRKSDNHQSASDFNYWLTNYSATRDANGNVTSVHIAEDDYLIYYPILQTSQGSNFKTFSTFFNDKWDYNSHLSFNLGARYDKLNAIDASHVKVGDDAMFSPRLGITYDVQGNGRFRANASYSRYVSRLSESIESATTVAGTPAVLAYFYKGPEFTGTPHEALARVKAWFDSRGGAAGLTDPTIRFVNNVPGGTQRLMNGRLSSPHVDEWTIGFGSQIGNGYLRADYINRDWKDFYTRMVNASTGQVKDNNGVTADLALIGNSDAFTRTYHAVEVQGQYKLLRRIDVGGSYTWSKLRGNTEGETGGSGPVTDGTITTYPEFKAFPQYSPIGYLSADQRHRLRAWGAVDVPTPFGKFNVSLLQRFDSGAPYSAAGTAVISPYTSAIAAATNYVADPTTATYYFSGRGQLRLDDISSTDLALNYELPVSAVRFFAQAQVLNMFNNQAVTGVDVSVLTNAQANCIQTGTTTRCARFNPFAGDVPREGVNFQRGPLFGKPTTTATPANVAAGTSSFQLPRTYRFSLGLRF